MTESAGSAREPAPAEPREPSPPTVSPARVILVLVPFVLVGAAAMLYLWHVLNRILTGDIPGAVTWLLATGDLAVVLGLLALLGRRLQSLED